MTTVSLRAECDGCLRSVESVQCRRTRCDVDDCLLAQRAGLSDCFFQSMKERVQMAHATLSTLQNAKLLFPGVDLYYMKMVYRTLIQSKMDYASFLCPCSTVAYHASQSLLQRLFQCCIGMRVSKSQIPRLLMMFNLETLSDRRRRLANAFASRLCNIQEDDTATER